MFGLRFNEPARRRFDRAALAERKAVVVVHQVAQIESDYALIIGDSIVERLWMDKLCGLPVVTAGVSGSTLAELEPLLMKIRSIRSPRIIILAAGINSFRLRKNCNLRDWEATLRSAIQTLGKVHAIVELIESDEVVIEAVKAANEILRSETERNGIALVSAIPHELTIDGVHPNDKGYVLWRRRLEQALADRV